MICPDCGKEVVIVKTGVREIYARRCNVPVESTKGQGKDMHYPVDDNGQIDRRLLQPMPPGREALSISADGTIVYIETYAECGCDECRFEVKLPHGVVKKEDTE